MLLNTTTIIIGIVIYIFVAIILLRLLMGFLNMKSSNASASASADDIASDNYPDVITELKNCLRKRKGFSYVLPIFQIQ